MTMRLSKIVPAHRHTIEFNWVKRDFMNFGEFKAARTRMKLEVYKTCFWCKRPFAEADSLEAWRKRRATDSTATHKEIT